MPHHVAAKIVALQPAIEGLLVKATSSPDVILEPPELDRKLIQVVRGLSALQISSFGVTRER